jgi:predicted RecA/RadA family phage recombinase
MPSLDNSQNPKPIIAPAAVAAGTCVLVGGMLYYCPEAIANGATGAGYWKNQKLKGVPKDTAAAWADGDTIYWDNTNRRFTRTAAGNTVRGFATGAQLIGATTGDIELVQMPT